MTPRLRLRMSRARAVAAGAVLALMSSVLIGLVGMSPANATIGTDDYPSNLRNVAQDSVVDPWSFYNRECVSFVAWRMNNDNQVPGGFTNNMAGGHWGSAYQWKNSALALGYTYNSTPVLGAVAWWNQNYHGASSAGHVAYVKSVNGDGSFDTEDYNSAGNGLYATHHYAVGSAYWPSGFIHIKDVTPPPPPPPAPSIIQNTGSTYLKADFNGDGKTDIASANDDGLGSTDLWVWLSNGATLSSPSLWWNGVGNGVAWTKIKPFAGDFNADGKTDVGMFQEVGTAWSKIWIWFSTGSSFTTPTVAAWDSGSGNFNLATSTPVVGDFNGDSKPDVAAATDNGAGSTDFWVWPGNGSSLNTPVRWWNGAGNGVVWSKIKPFSYDANSDGKADIVLFQDGGSSWTRIWAWTSTGSAFTTPTTALWDSGSGNYNTATATPVVGDFNGDGKVDVAAINDNGAGSSDIWTWLSTGSSLSAPTRWWNGAGNGVVWSKIKPFPIDITGDGKADFGDFQDAGTYWTKTWIWNSTGSAFTTPTSPVWDSGSGNYNAATAVPVS